MPLIAVAGTVLVATAPTLAGFLVNGRQAIAFVALLAAAVATSAFPVPLAGVEDKATLAMVVVLSAAVLYGAAVAAVVAVAAELASNIIERKPAVKIVFNGTQAFLAGAAAGMAAGALGGSHRPAEVIAATGVGALTWYAVNISLVCIAIARSRSLSTRSLIEGAARATAVPFLLATSIVPLVVVAWNESPFLAITAAGPLIAVGLHQAAAARAWTADTLALTDPLTGLGNRRHFDERLARELERAEREQTTLSLCALDLDDFKAINDAYGHAAGDEILIATASRLRRGGEAFRHGGDEFVLLLPGLAETEAADVAGVVCARIRELKDPGGQRITASAGTATISAVGSLRPTALLRSADAALYTQKKTRLRASAALPQS